MIIQVLVVCCLLCIPFAIWGSIFVHNRNLKKEFKKVQVGDIYKWEFRLTSNPFEGPTIFYAKIKEVKYDTSKNPWVEFYEGKDLHELTTINSMELVDFLQHFDHIKSQDNIQ